MAQYNAWQNNQLLPILNAMTFDELTKERGAFFGSIFGTLNHLLWGDTLWLNRFDPSVLATEAAMPHSLTLYPTLAAWSAQRFRTDGRITLWAERLKAIDLVGDLTLYSRAQDREMSKSMASCVIGFFNHQTHHRGQVHAMLTAAGQDAPVTDLIYMPPLK
ncbi:MAG: putative damage-inducible protein DinB [Ascidiaceihabitans sp.]|jgi:uncharacterized damage-inducible protein DinB